MQTLAHPFSKGYAREMKNCMYGLHNEAHGVTTNAWHKLCYRGFGTRLECVCQAALAAVLAVLVE